MEPYNFEDFQQEVERFLPNSRLFEESSFYYAENTSKTYKIWRYHQGKKENWVVQWTARIGDDYRGTGKTLKEAYAQCSDNYSAANRYDYEPVNKK